jgi:hypothetical protein
MDMPLSHCSATPRSTRTALITLCVPERLDAFFLWGARPGAIVSSAVEAWIVINTENEISHNVRNITHYISTGHPDMSIKKHKKIKMFLT